MRLTNLHRGLIWSTFLLLFVAVLSYLQQVLVPFAAAAIIAYLLSPIVARLERNKLPRWAATALILLLFFALLTGLVMLILPLVSVQISNLLAKLPEYSAMAHERAAAILLQLKPILPIKDLSNIPDMVKEQADTILKATGTIAGVIVSSSLKALNIISLMFLTPVLAFYLLRDWDRIERHVDSWWPRPYYQTIKQLLAQMDSAVAGFLRGQLLVSLSLGTFYAVCLSIVGLDFGFLIGLLSGALTFIPFVGSITGGLISIGVAFAQYDDWQSIAIIAVIYGVGQFLEGNVLSPKLVGSRVNLHPVWMIFALFAAGSLYGFLGVLLAVPVAAMIGVLLRFAMQQYKRSTLYTPTDTPKFLTVDHASDPTDA